MGSVELWLGPAGCGKTGRALAALRAELDRDWRGVRYLVPTVGHKRSIEHLLLERFDRPGLLGDPVTTFFNFAEEVALRANISGQRLSELQKELLLRRLIREAPLEYFARAKRYPGFGRALGEAIDELKVHMVLPGTLLEAAVKVQEQGAINFAQKLNELGSLYAAYQHKVYSENLYDNEGIMWIAALELLDKPTLFSDLRCLILDGFARLTPIQVGFLAALATQVERVIVLFDYEEGRTLAYHPVQDSLSQLTAAGLAPTTGACVPASPPRTTLEAVRLQLFRDRQEIALSLDDSLGLFIGATPLHEAELIARDIKALLRTGVLPDGCTPVTVDDIAILARDAGRVRDRLAQTFSRYGLTIRQAAPSPAHTAVGRALLATFRLVREGWKREEVLMLVQSGLLPLDRSVAFQIDLIARTNYLRSKKASWLEQWPDEATRAPLHAALAPLLAFDETYHLHGADPGALITAVETLVAAFHSCALATAPAFPDEDAAQATRVIAMEEAFARVDAIFSDLRGLGSLLGGFQAEETLEVITTALLRPPPDPVTGDGISILSAHTTGGEKFKAVYLCDMLEGSFPRHLRESVFLMDHERDESMRNLKVPLEPRKHLEEDERYWFLHALGAATRRLVLCYAENDTDGNAREHSSFVDEVTKLVPELPAAARRTTFNEVVPPLDAVENREEFIAGLAYALRTVRDSEAQPAARARVTAAYTACPWITRPTPLLATLFQRAGERPAVVSDIGISLAFAERRRAFSASELQAHIDCPFLWYMTYALGVRPVIDRFGALDRGQILHAALEEFYKGRQTYAGEPIHLEACTVDELWPALEVILRTHLEDEPRFQNRTAFLRDIEWEALSRMLRRFLRHEIDRATTRHLHPAYLERSFGFGHFPPLALGGGSVLLHGKIDRIDIADTDPSCAVVVDYKASAGMTLQDLASGKILQAPVYALAVERLLRMTPLGVEFLGLKQGETKGIYQEGIQPLLDDAKRLRVKSSADWQCYLEDCETILCTAAAAIRRGEIRIAPTTPRCPDRCEYQALCRGDKFLLARQVRAAQQAGADDMAPV